MLEICPEIFTGEICLGFPLKKLEQEKKEGNRWNSNRILVKCWV